MSLSLYAITAELQQLVDLLDSGELDGDNYAEVEGLMDRVLKELLPEKVAAYCGLIRSLELEAESFKVEEARLTARRKAQENLAERLQSQLQGALENANIGKLQAGTFAVSIQKNSVPALVIDAFATFDDCWLIPQPPVVDKAKIKKTLIAGGVVKGCRLNQGHHLRIR